jgi:hypothetical protein
MRAEPLPVLRLPKSPSMLTPALSFAVAVDSKFYRAHARFVATDKSDIGSQPLVYSPIIMRYGY